MENNSESKEWTFYRFYGRLRPSYRRTSGRVSSRSESLSTTKIYHTSRKTGWVTDVYDEGGNPNDPRGLSFPSGFSEVESDGPEGVEGLYGRL